MIRALCLVAVLGGCQAIFALEDKPSEQCADDSLQLCLDFEDALDDGALDQSGLHNDGELGDAERAMRGPGRLAIAVDNDSSVRVDGTSSLDARTSMTFELWYGFDTAPAVAAGLLARHGHYRITLLGEGRVRCSVAVTRTVDHEVETPGGFDGGWHQVACVQDGTRLAVYIDGAMQESALSPSTITGTGIGDPLYLGLDTDDAGSARFPFDGTLDDVRIFSRALTSDEIAANYLKYR